jgi:hypothetical protein
MSLAKEQFREMNTKPKHIPELPEHYFIHYVYMVDFKPVSNHLVSNAIILSYGLQ